MYQDNFFNELIIDNFAGGGGASVGIELAVGRPVDIAVNHDADAIAMHAVNHPYTTHYQEDVFAIDPVKVTGGRPVGIAWFSPDCFAPGTMILTSRGYIPIEEVCVGDLVLTHKLRWRPVTATMRTLREEMIVKGYGHPGIACSTGHPFYVKRRSDVWNNNARRIDISYSGAEWRKAKDIKPDADYWGVPTSYESLNIPEMRKHSRKGHVLPIDKRLLWLAGRYVGDGWTRLTDTRAELVITCGAQDIEGLSLLLDMWKRSGQRCKDGELAWSFRKVRTGGQFSTNCRSLVEWLRGNFGHLSDCKTIPAWLLGAEKDLREAFLTGYISADGHVRGGLTEISTVSKRLAYGIKSLAASLGYSPRVYFYLDPNDEIEGRKVDAKPSYKVKWMDEVDFKHRQTFIKDDILWSPIKETEKTGLVKPFYNISVAEDETYIAEGIIVHNCKHFSRAKGNKPVEHKIRGLSWVILKWAMSEVAPRCIFMENVEEIQTWGPLIEDADGKSRPDPKHSGETFKAFVGMLSDGVAPDCPALAEACEFLGIERGSADEQRLTNGLGYKVDYRTLRACDYGAPTIRKRFYLIARNDGQPIVFPKPTHGKGKGLKPYRTAAECIDWSIPCPSIFDREKPLVENTLRRIAYGLDKFLLKNPNPFIIEMNYMNTSQDIHKPMSTQTSANHHYIITPHIMQMNFENAAQKADEPMSTQTAVNKHFVIAPQLVTIGYGESKGQKPRTRSVEEPLTTIVSGGQKAFVCAPFLTQYYKGDHASAADKPMPTATVQPRNFITEAHLTIFRRHMDGKPSDEPTPTITAHAGHLAVTETILVKAEPGADLQRWALVRDLLNKYAGWSIGEDEIVLVKIDGEYRFVGDIGMRMAEPEELKLAQGFPKDYVIDIESVIGRKYSKAKQIARLGNAVCPPVATALIRANCADMAYKKPLRTVAELEKAIRGA
jgi:site-specific DNA-cytosine methylase